MGNSELLSSESISIGVDAYIEGLQIKYDFYKDCFGIVFLIGLFFFLIYILTRD